MHPAKTQISLGIHPVWSESLLSAWRKFGSLPIHLAHSEDSDLTGRMPRLIWVFAGRKVILLVLSWGRSFQLNVLPVIFQLQYSNLILTSKQILTVFLANPSFAAEIFPFRNTSLCSNNGFEVNILVIFGKVIANVVQKWPAMKTDCNGKLKLGRWPEIINKGYYCIKICVPGQWFYLTSFTSCYRWQSQSKNGLIFPILCIFSQI